MSNCYFADLPPETTQSDDGGSCAGGSAAECISDAHHSSTQSSLSSVCCRLEDLKTFFIENPGGRSYAIAGIENLPKRTNPDAAQIICRYCSCRQLFRKGVRYVQCVSCRSMNAVVRGSAVGGRVLNMLCAVCQTGNLVSYGAQFVRCGRCSVISDVSHAYCHQPEDRANNSSQRQRRRLHLVRRRSRRNSAERRLFPA